MSDAYNWREANWKCYWIKPKGKYNFENSSAKEGIFFSFYENKNLNSGAFKKECKQKKNSL